MNYGRLLFGDAQLRPKLLSSIVVVGLSGFGWLYLVGLLDGHVSNRIGLVLWFGVPVLISVAAVGVCAYRGKGILLGWILAAAPAFGTFTMIFYSELQKTGEGTIVEVLAAGAMWSLLFALVFGAVGLGLGAAIRYMTSENR